MTKKEALTKLDEYDLPFIFWGHKGDCILGCDNLVIRFNELFNFPEDGIELGIKYNTIYYPSLAASRVEEGFEDGSVKLYPYRRRKAITMDVNPLNDDIGVAKLREVCKSKLSLPLNTRKVIIDDWEDDTSIIDVSDDILVEKEIVEILREITGEVLGNCDGSVSDGYITIRGKNFIASISEKVVKD
jgi:hypothetical protein